MSFRYGYCYLHSQITRRVPLSSSGQAWPWQEPHIRGSCCHDGGQVVIMFLKKMIKKYSLLLHPTVFIIACERAWERYSPFQRKAELKSKKWNESVPRKIIVSAIFSCRCSYTNTWYENAITRHYIHRMDWPFYFPSENFVEFFYEAHPCSRCRRRCLHRRYFNASPVYSNQQEPDLTVLFYR